MKRPQTTCVYLFIVQYNSICEPVIGSATWVHFELICCGYNLTLCSIILASKNKYLIVEVIKQLKVERQLNGNHIVTLVIAILFIVSVPFKFTLIV